MAGDALTEGHIELQALFKYKGKEAVEEYILKEILGVYASQGQKLNSKHLEVIVRQMFSRVRIIDPGDTDLLPGEIVEKTTLFDEEQRNKVGKGKLAEFEELFLGITKVSLSTESWLSAASFQETARVLINAAVTGKVDRLSGLKENVIIGRLIPSGTGYGATFEDEEEEFEEEEDVVKASDLPDDDEPVAKDEESTEEQELPTEDVIEDSQSEEIE